MQRLLGLFLLIDRDNHILFSNFFHYRRSSIRFVSIRKASNENLVLGMILFLLEKCYVSIVY